MTQGLECAIPCLQAPHLSLQLLFQILHQFHPVQKPFYSNHELYFCLQQHLCSSYLNNKRHFPSSCPTLQPIRKYKHNIRVPFEGSSMRIGPVVTTYTVSIYWLISASSVLYLSIQYFKGYFSFKYLQNHPQSSWHKSILYGNNNQINTLATNIPSLHNIITLKFYSKFNHYTYSHTLHHN